MNRSILLTLNKRAVSIASMCVFLFGWIERSGADEARLESPVRAQAAIDLPLLGLSTTLWIAPSIANRGLPGPSCDPCDPRDVSPIDRWVIGSNSSFANVSGDVSAFAFPILALAASWLSFDNFGWRGIFEDILLLTQSITITGAVNQITRHAVRRPRPFMYRANLQPEERQHIEATLSFFSGHVASVFAIGTTASYLFGVRNPNSPWKFALWGATLAAGTFTAVSRLAAGEHFLTDVITGAVVGAAVGWLVPRLHRNTVLGKRITFFPVGGGAGVAGLF